MIGGDKEWESTLRLACFDRDGQVGVGRIDGEEIVEVPHSWTDALVCLMDDAGRTELEHAGTGLRLNLKDVQLLPPIGADGRGVFCAGLNYSEHVEELAGMLGGSRDGKPPIFWKLTASLLAPNRTLVTDKELSREVDWEVELGVVLGRGGRRIPEEEVGDYVAGYTVVVDTTLRDLQKAHGQWFIGKNLHASSPIGPWVVSVDEVGYPPSVELSLYVNGVEKQRSMTDLMIWRIAELVSMTSAGVELRPGDVFATGSPPGVGFTREPPEFLVPGDVLKAAIERVGVLEHVVE